MPPCGVQLDEAIQSVVDTLGHLVVADRQAVISPSSIHSGVGTAAYSFVWAMTGENQSFDDMDGAPVVSWR